jgi:hypothetical protein
MNTVPTAEKAISERIERPWGEISDAMDVALDFWEWWDRDPDSDQKLIVGPFDAVKQTVEGYLPPNSDPDMPRFIGRIARLLTMEDWITTCYKDALNDAILNLSTDSEENARQMLGESEYGEEGRRHVLEEQDADDIFKLAKIVNSQISKEE